MHQLLEAAQIARLATVKTLDNLSERITKLTDLTNKNVVLLTTSSRYEPFLYFLGMLQTKYLSGNLP
ncbi:MAG: hypothetical protein RMJ87_12465 [Cytophagales bacterium]|nr:hypothetical protein [Bernardetiaceae bacterium]MDW8205834.1 hypothetical protein [Cytophagales bacterium]